MHNLYCNVYNFYPTNSYVIDFVWNVSKEKKYNFITIFLNIEYFVFFLWEINLFIIQGASLYYVTDFVCIMCTIVNWVHTNIFKRLTRLHAIKLSGVVFLLR